MIESVWLGRAISMKSPQYAHGRDALLRVRCPDAVFGRAGARPFRALRNDVHGTRRLGTTVSQETAIHCDGGRDAIHCVRVLGRNKCDPPVRRVRVLGRNKCDPPVCRDSPFSGGTRLSCPGFCNCLLGQTTRRRCAGTPNTVIPGSTLRITALPIPTVAPLPIEMRGTILAPGNTDARSPIDTPPPIDTSE